MPPELDDGSIVHEIERASLFLPARAPSALHWAFPRGRAPAKTRRTTLAISLLDLHAQYAAIGAEVEAAAQQVLRSQRFILGPVVESFEAQIARYCQCGFGVGMSSGTDALLACLMAEGIGQGDEVITSPFSFFATAGAIHRVGAKPVFVDIDADTFNIDPARIEAAITPRTRAIIPVHLFGQMAEMDPIMEVAKRKDLIVIEDAAQAIGAEYKGRRAGAIGDYGCLSFFPSKNLGGAGDGGMTVCRDPARAERLRQTRNHGGRERYFHEFVGGNFRLDALQAAILQVKLKYLDEWTTGRQRNAARYRALFAASGRVVENTAALREHGQIVLPREAPARRHIYNQFVIRVQRRDALRAFLTERGIGCEVYYPRPFHLQECFAYLGLRAGAFALSERASSEVLALPIYPELSDAQLQLVAGAVLEFLAAAA
jgi:dTDP-4-amino-4,6-dideoxygalactose transaminase